MTCSLCGTRRLYVRLGLRGLAVKFGWDVSVFIVVLILMHIMHCAVKDFIFDLVFDHLHGI